VALLLAVAGPATPTAQHPGNPAPAAAHRAASPEPTPLVLGAPVARDLKDGETHMYAVTLVAGQFLDASVEQTGVDALITVTDRSGEQVGDFDSQSHRGPEPIALIAVRDGTHLLRIEPLDGTATGGRYEIAIRAIREATPVDRKRVSAEVLFAQGRRLRDQSTPDTLPRAAVAFEQTLPVWRELGVRAREADTLTQLGDIYQSLRNHREAIDRYTQAVPALRDVGENRRAAVTMGSIGHAHYALGDYQQALDFYREAFEGSKAAGSDGNAAVWLTSLGLVYNALGEEAKALSYYEQALPIFRTIGQRNAEAIALADIGLVYRSTGDLRKALDYYQQALPLFKAARSRRREADTLNQVGIVYQQLGDAERARDAFTTALAMVEGVGDRRVEAQSRLGIGSVHASAREFDAAFAQYDRALALWRGTADRAGEARALSAIARAKRDAGRLADARATIESALDVIESLRSTVASHSLRASYLASRYDDYEFEVDLLVEMHQREPGAGYDAAALQASERGRARSLLEMLALARAEIREGVDPVLLERQRDLQLRLNGAESRRNELLARNAKDNDVAAAKSTLDGLLTEYWGIQKQIRLKNPKYAALTQPQPIDVRAIQERALNPDTLLLEYALGRDRSFLWAVTASSLSVHVLPGRETIEKVARQAHEAFLQSHHRERARQAQLIAGELSRILLTPVAAQLEGKRLVIVPDGILQYIPFAALPVPGECRTSTGYCPLVSRHEIATTPSASALAALRSERRARPPATKLLAVLSDPVFDANDPRVKKAPSNGPDGKTAPWFDALGSAARDVGLEQYERLPASRREAESIARLAVGRPVFTALDFAASRQTLMDPELGRYRVVHVATHGLINSTHPELSGLVLSLVDENGGRQDGFVRAHEIYNLTLAADLVVLSACQTALGKDVRGEGLLGLTRGFMYAGVPQVAATLWSVRDSATAELMTRFYQAMLRDNLEPAAALRAAQVAMWSDPRWSAPYYWAAFVIQGGA
jgi:CHAT domain-containing protein/tetratricopeptide (TPR) repeat protein